MTSCETTKDRKQTAVLSLLHPHTLTIQINRQTTYGKRLTPLIRRSFPLGHSLRLASRAFPARRSLLVDSPALFQPKTIAPSSSDLILPFSPPILLH